MRTNQPLYDNYSGVLFANIPAELRLMRPLAKLGNHLKRVFNSTLQACYSESRRLFLIFLLTYIHFDGASNSHGHTLYPGMGGGAGCVSSLII